MSSNSGFAPNAFESFCALMIGGNGYGPPALLRLSRNPEGQEISGFLPSLVVSFTRMWFRLVQRKPRSPAEEKRANPHAVDRNWDRITWLSDSRRSDTCTSSG